MATQKPTPISRHESPERGVFKVVSPLGDAAVQQRPMVPRLDTLAGKTIGLIWNHSFKSQVTLPVIAELLVRQYPSTKVIPYTEMPNYPAFKSPPPGTTNPEQAALAAAFREKGCDAVISGNGG